MNILPIYLYDHPVLRAKAQPIKDMNDELLAFVENLFATMHNADGIGLAANQVGRNEAIITIDISDVDEELRVEPIALINPVVEYYSEDTIDYEEGCLSLPGFRETVIRPAEIQVRYFDCNMNEKTLTADGLLSRVLQHEIDHLNGIYFFERLSSVRRALTAGKLKKIQRGDAVANYEVVLGKTTL